MNEAKVHIRFKKSSTDYYPFGQEMPGRKFYPEKYRFSYQGSVKDNEIINEGINYSTLFREMDVRIGKWWSVDPERSITPWESPYVSMKNNPIWLNDKFGNIVEGASATENASYSEFKKQTQNKITSLSAQLKSAKNGRQETKIKNEIKQYQNELNELHKMETSNVVYRIRMGSNITNSSGDGNIIYNTSTQEVDINIVGFSGSFNTNQLLAHELKHGFQYETNQLVFLKDGIQNNNCKQFEKDAYKRTNLYAEFPTELVDVNKIVNDNYRYLTENPIFTVLQASESVYNAGNHDAGTNKSPAYYKNWQFDYYNGLINLYIKQFLENIKKPIDD